MAQREIQERRPGTGRWLTKGGSLLSVRVGLSISRMVERGVDRATLLRKLRVLRPAGKALDNLLPQSAVAVPANSLRVLDNRTEILTSAGVGRVW